MNGRMRAVRSQWFCDPHPVEDYFQWNWEYPGAWYLYVAIPVGYKSRKVFIDTLVKKTLEQSKQDMP